MKTRRLVVLLLLPFAILRLHAGWIDDIGYRVLTGTFTSGVPTSVTGGVTQTEAPDGAGSYLPDDAVTPANAEFTGKTITNKGTTTTASAHASLVGTYFYGGISSIVPATTLVDVYNANDWINTQGIAYTSGAVPPTEDRRVQNHSWISVYGSEYTATEINSTATRADTRLDFAINRDGFSSVVGVNNGASTTLPALLCQSYHTISVGLYNGAHSAGLTAYDGAGRMKPDVVAFDGATSFATPQVSGAAGLLSQKLRDTSAYSAVLTGTGDYPRITKALILAGAAKDQLSSWTRASTAKPYDAVYGAGALNVFLSYRILVAGRQAASTTTVVAETGWDVTTASTTSTRTYLFDVPAGSVQSRFSAALTWHRAVTTTQAMAGTGGTLANLDLTLYNATGTTIGTQVDASLSTVDNVEHIYLPTLAPGRYALRVSSSSATSTRYALAWRTSPTVNVTTTNALAKESDGTAGTFTVTRTGSTTSPLLVPLAWSGTAVAGTHYITPPTTLLIPAGSASATVTITPVSDDIAQGNRTVILTAATDITLSAGATPSATVTVQDKPYDTWRFTHFTTEELADTTISGAAADPDADGQTNLLEYALNADPKAADALTHAPVVGTASDHVTFTYTRSNTATDITYNVTWSPDLATWTSGTTVVEPVSSTDNGNGTTTVVVRSVNTLTATPTQFLRLTATRS